MVDLPLRGINFDSTVLRQKNIPAGQTTVGNIWWGMVDSNHRRRCQQIYSLPPLATREFPHLKCLLVGGAGRRIRTPDLLITNQLLYQLSYTSISISAVYSNRTFGVCQHIFYARNEGE